MREQREGDHLKIMEEREKVEERRSDGGSRGSGRRGLGVGPEVVLAVS